MRKWLKQNPLIYRTNMWYKAGVQERLAARELAEYRRRAEIAGIVPPEGSQLSRALRERLVQRGLHPKARSAANLHVFLTYSESDWEEVLQRTLLEYGRLTVFEWTKTHGFDERLPGWLDRRDEMNRRMLEAFEKANAEQPIDVVVGYCSGTNTDPAVLQRMGQLGAVVLNFCWDDKLKFRSGQLGQRWRGVAGIASAIDLNLTNARNSIIKYVVEGGLAMFWPEAAHPLIHRRHEIPFEFDISFVGACYGWRPTLIKQLRRLGLNVETFGGGWPNGRISDEEMIRLYSRSRINLGIGGVGYSTRLTCLKGRDFEVPMSGGLYVTLHNPELAEVFEIGKEIVTYRDAGDLAVKARRLLANRSEADQIREAGYRRALRDHSWKRRFDDVFRFVGVLE